MNYEEQIQDDFKKHPGSWRPDPENWYREGWITGYNAAEKEWRARIAAEVLEMGEPTHANAHLGLGFHTAKRIALRILKRGWDL